MSKAPETIYISQNCAQHTFKDSASRGDFDVGYVRSDIAYGYACEVERLRARVAELEAEVSSLREIVDDLKEPDERDTFTLSDDEIETMARDALEKEG